MAGLTLLIILMMLILNGIFAGFEIALASVSIGRLERLAGEGRRGAAAALRMKGSIEASLAVVQVGITLAGMVAAAVGGAGAEESVEPYLIDRGFGPTAAQTLAIALVVAPLTAITIVFGELVPKVFSLRHKEWVCLLLSPPMEWFGFAVWPAVWVFERSTNVIMSLGNMTRNQENAQAEEATLQEIRAAANVARTRRLIGSREEGIIVGASELSETPVRNSMLPAEHISMLNANDPLGVSLVAAHNDMHTRFPVTERAHDPQGIIGYVNFKDIVACMRTAPERPNLHGVLRPIPSFQEDTSLSGCLDAMIQTHTHIALIRNKDSKILGMITLEDILEEFIGDIRDEYDRLPSYVTASGIAWIVGGGTTLRAFHSATRVSLPGTESDGLMTLHGWFEQRKQGQIRGGDTIREAGFRILARKVRRGRLLEALISPDTHLRSTGQDLTR